MNWNRHCLYWKRRDRRNLFLNRRCSVVPHYSPCVEKSHTVLHQAQVKEGFTVSRSVRYTGEQICTGRRHLPTYLRSLEVTYLTCGVQFRGKAKVNRTKDHRRQCQCSHGHGQRIGLVQHLLRRSLGGRASRRRRRRRRFRSGGHFTQYAFSRLRYTLRTRLSYQVKL